MPEPRRERTTPSAASVRSPARTVGRLTPTCAREVALRRQPRAGPSAPRSISCRTWVTTAAALSLVMPIHDDIMIGLTNYSIPITAMLQRFLMRTTETVANVDAPIRNLAA